MTSTSDVRYFNHTVHVHTDRQPNVFESENEVMRDIEEPLYLQAGVHTILPGGRLQPWLVGKPIELCAFFERAERDMLLKVFFGMANRHGNRLNSCPVRRMQFAIRGVELSPAHLPSFAPAGVYRFSVHVRRKGEAGKMAIVSHFAWIGEIVRK